MKQYSASSNRIKRNWGKKIVHLRNSLRPLCDVQGGNKYNNNLDMTCNRLEGFV